MIRALSNDPVNGRWVLTGLMGRGAEATVYRGFDMVNERRVALKVLGGNGSAPRVQRRARREFLHLAGLRHESLVETYDFDVADSGPLPPGSPFFTMELLREASLHGSHARRDPWFLVLAALDLLSALECLHLNGLVHNDVKPSNVFAAGASSRCRVKLGDLGLATRGRAVRSRSRRFSGTLRYASPESLAGGPIDARSDLYSLGVLLYEAATGSLPFGRSDPAAGLLWHLEESRCRGGGGDGRLPAALSPTIARLLAALPEQRFARARDAWEEIVNTLPLDISKDAAVRTAPESPLVGRSAEVRTLRAWLTGSSRARDVLTIAGPYGSGLSRIGREAGKLGLAHGFSVHPAVCRAGDHPFSPFRKALREAVLRSRVRRLSGMTSEEQVLALLAGPALWEAPARVFGSAEDRIAGAIARLLREQASPKPLLVVLDDFDKADAGTRRVVGYLSRPPRSPASRVLVVTLQHEDARSLPPERRGPWLAGRGLADEIGEGRGREGCEPATSTRPRSSNRNPLAHESTGEPFRREPGGIGCCLRLGPLSIAAAKRLIAALPLSRKASRSEVAALIRDGEALAGRIVHLSRAMVRRQGVLFPPLVQWD